MTSKRIALKPGYVIVDVSSATGGVTYARQYGSEDHTVNNGEGYEVEIATRKRVDHEEIVKHGDQLIQAARYALRKRCVNTGLGWFCDVESLDAVRLAFERLKDEADEFNGKARTAGSARRVYIGFVPLKVEPDLAEAAHEIAATVRNVCTDLIEKLRAGEVDKLAPVFLRSKNLDKLATGLQRDAIVLAIENAKECRTALRQAKREKRDLAAFGQELNVEWIEACHDNFLEGTEDESDSVALAS